MKKVIAVFAVLVLMPLGAVQAQQRYAEARYALVIGNGAYTGISRLNNPVNDATDMAAALESLGFTVDRVIDGSLGQMEDGVLRLRNRLSTSKDAYGFFFYAGHGVQSNGTNYLIPVDANIRSETQLRERAMSVQFMLGELNTVGNALNVVVLDACRDNPFSWARTGSRGLVVEGGQPADSIIVFATSAGSTAADGTGRNGLFTGELLKHLRMPGLEVREVFRRTGGEVARVSGGTQRPAVYDQFYGSAIFLPTPSVVTPVPVPVVTALPVPRNVRAGTPGTDSVTLTWESAEPGLSYRVYCGFQNDPGQAAALGTRTTGTSFTINRMTSGITYYFWVASVKDGRESGKSGVVAVQTAAAAPPEQPKPAPSGMVRIQGGSFTMGSPSSEAGWGDDETQHQVTVSSFYMGKYEVTQKEYQAVMGTNPSSFKGDNLPVENVSWYDAVNYCNALSKKEGLTPAYTVNGNNVTWNKSANGYRLPTEAEWEYACRAGTTGPYSSGSSVGTAGWYDSNSGSKTHPVGQKQANAWGLYDMHGNVWEWCWDWYGPYPGGSQTDPTGASSGGSRAARGGSWGSYARGLRSAYRFWHNPSIQATYLGIRLVRSWGQ
jgi:formylglycine-generating enzyme required for sulfatase activity